MTTYRNDAIRSDAINELYESLEDLKLQLVDAVTAGHQHYANNVREDIRWCEQSISRLRAQAAA